MPQPIIPGTFHPDEEWGAVKSISLSVASSPSSCSRGFGDTDFTQEMIEEDSRRKLMSKNQKLEAKLKMEEQHLAFIDSYMDEILKNLETMCYRI